MQTEISAAVNAAPKPATPMTYYHELDNTYYSVTKNTFIGQVYSLFGLQSIADSQEVSSDYPQLSAESIITADPDFIFLADGGFGESPATVAARPGWSNLKAVTDGQCRGGRCRHRVTLGTTHRRLHQEHRVSRRSKQWRRDEHARLGETKVVDDRCRRGVPRRGRSRRDDRPSRTCLLGELGIIWNVRMPRVALAGIVGAMLSLAGASYQGVFRNPLVDPYLLGVAAGAGLGATIIFAVGREATRGWPVDPLPVVSFVGGLVAVMITYLVGAAFGASRSASHWSLPASPSSRCSPRFKRSCCNATTTSFARSTPGSSDAFPRRRGQMCVSSCRTSWCARRSCCFIPGISTCSASVTTRRLHWVPMSPEFGSSS